MMINEQQDFNPENRSGQNQQGGNANWPVKLLTATSIIGDRVYNKSGQHLGKIKDIMLNIQHGGIEYIVLEYGGFLGMGGKLFALPFQALELDNANQIFLLNMEKEELENAPGFDQNHWPDTNSHSYSQKSGSSWGGFMGANTGGFH